ADAEPLARHRVRHRAGGLRPRRRGRPRHRQRRRRPAGSRDHAPLGRLRPAQPALRQRRSRVVPRRLAGQPGLLRPGGRLAGPGEGGGEVIQPSPPLRPTGRRQPWKWLLAALVLAGACWGAGAYWGWWRRAAAVPEVELAGIDPEVADAIRQAREEVSRRPGS